MTNYSMNIGFTYFTSLNYLVERQIKDWMPALRQLGASSVIFKAGFDRAIPEDAIRHAQENGLESMVHFTEELPLARKFNDVAVLLDVYAKWGVKKVILGNKPNTKSAWPTAGWQYENLVDHFLDRLIPLATYAVRIGISPILPPMKPGGDYWDSAFVELVLAGLRRRRLDGVLDKMILSSYGYTFNKPLSWGTGGPERWSVSKPYLTPEGQEDQLGFHNFEWIQASGQRATGTKMPVLILDAGNPGLTYSQSESNMTIETIQRILLLCHEKQNLSDEVESEAIALDSSVVVCTFALDTLEQALGENFNTEVLIKIFGDHQDNDKKPALEKSSLKIISHYLLLPSHNYGVSDVVLNKIRPLIKKLHPTIGFSIEEASLASKVSVFPDSILFTDEKINQLRSAGCRVEVLPESGIEIATSLQGS